MDSGVAEGYSSSLSASGTRHITLVTNTVI